MPSLYERYIAGGIEAIGLRDSRPVKSVTKLPDDHLDRALLARHEENYVSGATDLVRQEIALTQQSIYHRPSHPDETFYTEALARRHAFRSVERTDYEVNHGEDDDWGVNLGTTTVPTVILPCDNPCDDPAPKPLPAPTTRRLA